MSSASSTSTSNFGRQANFTAYVKTFVQPQSKSLWKTIHSAPCNLTSSGSFVTPTSAKNLYIPGDLCVAGSMGTVSDVSLKENIEDISIDTVNKLSQLNPRQYNFKDSKHDSNGHKKKRFGFIAQEMEEVYPELVITNPDGTKGINYVELVPLLVKKIQLLEQEIEYIWDNK